MKFSHDIINKVYFPIIYFSKIWSCDLGGYIGSHLEFSEKKCRIPFVEFRLQSRSAVYG